MLMPGTVYRCQVGAEVLDGVDVLVAGGGTAGVAAALASARTGARTLLVEQSGSLGGMMTRGNAGLTMYMAFSGDPRQQVLDEQALSEDPDSVQVAGGLAMQVTRRLLDRGEAIGTHGQPGRYVFTHGAALKRLLFEMIAEAGVQLRLHSMVVDVVTCEGRIEGVVLESKSGRQVVPAGQVVDATGDGDVAVRAGAGYTVGVTDQDVCATPSTVGKMMSMGVMVKLAGVQLERTFNWLDEHPECFGKQLFARLSLEQARAQYRAGAMSTFCIRTETPRHSMQVYTSPNPGEVTLCCPSVEGDGADVESLTRAETTMAAMLGRWMQRIGQLPGFEQSYLQDQPEMGVRETRHIRSRTVLTIEDIYHGKSFDDCIGLGSHPIDTHPRPEWLEDPETAYPPRWSFQIPFSCLSVEGIVNLLTAGRCISATHEAFGCIRPTVQCMITGEAAGAAAGLCAVDGTDPEKLDVQRLRQHLVEHGVKL